MSEKLGVTMRYRAALVGGLAVFVMLQAALFALTRDSDDTKQTSQRESARLVNLPETGAPLADVSRAPTPDPTEDLAPHRAEVETLADIPVVPKLSAAASSARPVMFMENLEEPEAEQNPAVSYAPSDFLAASNANARPLRPIDDRPVSVLAAIGGSGRGIGIGADGPHCLPGRPAMFQRSPVVSGVPSLLRSPRM